MTISINLVVFLVVSGLLFALVTAFCWRTGLFDDDSYGVGLMFTLLFYSIGWLAPSLLLAMYFAFWNKA